MNDIRLPILKRRSKKVVDVCIESPKSETPTADVLIVGAGFAGLGAAIRLQQAGIRDIVILERGIEVGGTWRDNQYPGAACDIPSNLYSYSFAQNPEWSRGFSGSREILGYVHQLVAKFDLAKLVRFQQNVTSMAFDEAAGVWNVSTANGETRRGRSVVMAQGPLSNSSWPKIAGLDTYEGHKIHSARWDHSYDFSGKKVAVVGTGASAIQIVQGVAKLLGENLKVLDVKPEVQAKYNAGIQQRLKRTNWNSGCSSWYLTEDGFNATMYPGLATQFRAQMARFENSAYRAVAATITA